MEALLETLPVPAIDQYDLPAVKTTGMAPTADNLTIASWAECEDQLG
jgi:hypothetical protein